MKYRLKGYKRISCSCIIGLLVFFSGNLMANEQNDLMAIEDFIMDFPVVVSSTLTERKAIEAPSTMTIITEEDIRDMGAKNIYDILDKVNGVVVRNNRLGTRNITFRGNITYEANDTIKFMVNGHDIKDPLVGGCSSFYDISLLNVKRIEILRGPGSALYGTDAFSCVINVITRTPHEDYSNQVGLRLGSFDTQTYNLTFNNQSYDLRYQINLSHFETQGDNLTLEQDGFLGNPLSLAPGKLGTFQRNSKVDLFLQYKNFSLDLSHLEHEAHKPIPEFTILTEKGEERVFTFSFIELKHDWSWTDHINLRSTLSYDYFTNTHEGQDYPYATPFRSQSGAIFDLISVPNGARHKYENEVDALEGQLILEYKPSDKHEFLWGVFYEKVKLKEIKLSLNVHPLEAYYLGGMYTLPEEENIYPPDVNREIWGSFIQEYWKVTDQLDLLLGGRYDHYSDFGSTFTPRSGIVYQVGEKNNFIKLLYGRAFKAPTLNELYLQNASSFLGNRDLGPEEVDTYELVFENELTVHLRSNLSFYYLETKDLIEVAHGELSNLTQHLTYENLGETEVYGLETDIQWNLNEKSEIQLSYAYTHGENKRNSEALPFIPEHQGLITFRHQWNDKIKAYVNFEYTGELPREKGDPREDVEATWVTDCTLRYEPVKGWKLYLSAYNIFDEETYSPSLFIEAPLGDLPQPGRHFALGCTLDF